MIEAEVVAENKSLVLYLEEPDRCFGDTTEYLPNNWEKLPVILLSKSYIELKDLFGR